MATTHKTEGSLALENRQVKVITIEATKHSETVRLRVAAYARVSSSSEDQLNSFAAQNRYYTDLIANNSAWQLVDIYADEGITGTSLYKRDDFQRMINDCQKGKIDRILVKSLSRFARNTSDCLTTIRKLKALGVTAFFEKEGIDTANMTGEMLTAIYAAFAQSESESISSNMRWSYKKRMQSGKFITCKAPFGYRLTNGALQIEESEAIIVRKIFNDYLSGITTDAIAEEITKTGILTRDGSARWYASAIQYILQNEKYVGDALLQKKFSTDTMPIQKKRNQGEKEKYYVEKTHPAIIDADTYYRVRELYEYKSNSRQIKRGRNTAFSKKIICGECGTCFTRKICSNVTCWICNRHLRHHDICTMMPITEEKIEIAFCRLYYKLKKHGKDVLLPMLHNYQQIRNRRMLWSEDIIELNKQISDLSSQNQMLTMLKQQGLIDPDIFIAQINDLTEQLRETKLKKERLLDAESDDYLKQTQELIDLLEGGPDFLDAFDADMFGELIEKVEVESQTVLCFYLKNGLALKEIIERTDI